ncbi:receptor-interacting serine/threonine-protein kinase 3-like [Scleropages formosus]|uniref:receptor-interacting serine/threonine-protein kinase 3-like n=1 Tax=Scleropages formosus TaxID=113540 RepID=UPI0010FA995F|nr:receptor-interacting serine/threonine-protein kinase 3-like [Scleropages formosus]
MDMPALICDSSLESWQHIGSGGFGQIYKVKHTEWRMDVVVKLLHVSSNSSLLKEAHLMRHGGNPHVLRILGVYNGTGYHISRDGFPKQGLVMEFMERGSLASLLEVLNKPLPLPLTLRLAHQVALGMNFLHCLSPPLLHLDLKPSNVLLDDSLNAKVSFGNFKNIELWHFGCPCFLTYYTHTQSEKENEFEEKMHTTQCTTLHATQTSGWQAVQSVSTGSTTDEGGTISYMPPEAFDMSYKPTPASDVYSYSILLWSIITGQEPYPSARSTIVRFRVPEGDRPSLEMVDPNLAEHLKDMISLMKRCWNNDPSKRPSFQECLQVTEAFQERHKSGVKDAVHQVLTFLDSPEIELGKRLDALNIIDPTQLYNAGSNKASTTPEPMRSDLYPTQVPAKLSLAYTSHQASRCSEIHLSRGKLDLSAAVEFGLFIADLSSTALPPARTLSMDPCIVYNQMPPASSPAGPWQQSVINQAAVPVYCQGPGVSIFMSNVTGLQIGNNNKMTIQRSRIRHCTAPDAISQSSPKNSGANGDRSAPGT